MDPMKSRRWIAAAALAAAVVFLVMVTGEHGPAAPDAAPAPVSSSEAVLASDGGPPEDDAAGGGGGKDADREEVIGALQGLLDALGISADELADGAESSDCGSGAKGKSGNSNGAANGDCSQSEPASADRSGDARITIAGFAFGQPLTVAPGEKVEVVNTDAATHNVTAADGSFETPDLKQGDTATITAPSTPGRYEFSCTLHPEMTGILIVEGSGGGQGRSRSSGDGDGSRQHQSTAPGRDGMGSSNGY